MNKKNEQEGWKLRDLALSELVPVRVRNVVIAQAEDVPLLQLELPEAVRRWHEVEFYLRKCRNMGEGSITRLRKALESVVKGDNSQQTGSDFTCDSVLIKTLREFSFTHFAPVRIRNTAATLNDSHGLLELSPKEALKRWTEIESYFLQHKSIGLSSCHELCHALEHYVGAGKSPPKITLVQHIVSRSSGIVESIKKIFSRLPSIHPLQRLSTVDASTYLPILRYQLLRNPSIGRSKIAQFENQMRLLESKVREATGYCAEQDDLYAELAEHPFAYKPASLILELIRGESTRASLRKRLGNCYIIDLLHKRDLFEKEKSPWFTDLVATFLFESKWWFDDLNGMDQLRLSSEGLSRLKAWYYERDASLSTEWVCIHLIVKLGGLIRSIKVLTEVFENTKDNGLLIEIANSNSFHRVSFREQLVNSPVLLAMLEQIGLSAISDKHVELSSTEVFELLLGGLRSRNRDIVLSKIAPTKGDSLTLKEAGRVYNVTRERIRQLVLNWMQRIENDGRVEIAANHVKKLEQKWARLVNSTVENSPEGLEVEKLTCHFSQEEKLILAACNDTPKKWLERHYRTIDGRVTLLRANDERITEAEDFLSKVLASKTKLPQLANRIPGAPDHLTQTVLFTKAVHSGELAAFITTAGVVLAANNSTDSRRTASVVSIFEKLGDLILSDQQLWSEICGLSDNHSVRGQWRVFKKCIRAEPTRFRRLTRIGWMDLANTNLSKNYKPVREPLLTPRTAMGIREDFMGDKNQRGRLYSLISKSGGVYAKEAIRLWADQDTDGSGASVGFLLDDPYFVICHPGMTGCLDDNGELVSLSKIYERLRNIKSLHTYMLFRQGGFGPLDFPAWDATMLEEWLKLAESSIRDDVAQRIAAQLKNDIDICHKVKATNSTIRSVMNDFGYLESPRRPADNTIPTLEDVFRLAAIATRFGFLNYYLVNCCTGRHWYSHRSISWLAFLIAAGIIERADHWQKMHRVTDRGREFLFRLVGSAMEHEVLNWSKVPIGQEILELTADTWRENTHGSWVVPSEFARLVVAITDPVRRNANTLLNSEIFQLSSSRRMLPPKKDINTGTFVDPFLDRLLG